MLGQHLQLSLPDHFRDIMDLLTYEPTSAPSSEWDWEWEPEESVRIIGFPAGVLGMKEGSLQDGVKNIQLSSFTIAPQLGLRRCVQVKIETTYGSLRKFDVDGVFDRGKPAQTRRGIKNHEYTVSMYSYF